MKSIYLIGLFVSLFIIAGDCYADENPVTIVSALLGIPEGELSKKVNG